MLGAKPWSCQSTCSYPLGVILLCLCVSVCGVALDYIEIGTADFDTLAQQLHGTDPVGLSIEPVEEHFQQLPVKETSETKIGQRKLWAAVAEQDGEADLYVVRPEYMEPQCSNATVRQLGLQYCLPWWFRATASLHKPAALVDVHAGEKAVEAQMVVKVPTVSYASLMERFDVTSLHLLKIDTEGFDVLILRQMLKWGKTTSQYPERVQFERNNLTDAREAEELFFELQAVYDCWAPATEDDVQCLRLGNIAAGDRLPTASSGWFHMEIPSWWRMELPDRLTVAAVQLATSTGPSGPMAVTVGDSPVVHQNRRCGHRSHGRSDDLVALVAHCALEGRYVGLLGSSKAEDVEILVPLLGEAFRLSMGRVCCHRECNSTDTHLFEGYDPRCEERCRNDRNCRFFTSFSSLWCITYADCDEELLSLLPGTTFGIAQNEFLPLPLNEARQSSLDWGGEPERAIDGKFDPHFLMGSCSHTAEETDSNGTWWAASTALPFHAISAVRVLGRWDCCHERLDGWEVRIGFDPDPRQNPLCGMQQRVLPAGSRRLVKCGEALPGNVVGVVLPSGQALTLCEVEAFGPFRW
ncbi:unnamed protein product [Cladocopium goreaui]|uniref:Fucolectin-1 n=1 Tax=Cladocopium goreaui TaxID=2562237 RepID=A0A9P1CIS5_9DINO|nr:unnamed protein product [Cladocopium goreaui]